MSKFGRKGRKQCPFASAGVEEIDYKDVKTLMKYVTDLKILLFHKYLSELPSLSGLLYDFTLCQGLVPQTEKSCIVT